MPSTPFAKPFASDACAASLSGCSSGSRLAPPKYDDQANTWLHRCRQVSAAAGAAS